MAKPPAIPDIYVQPGESHLVCGAAVMRTVLGSCVGVTFWNARLEIGALCHPMLPRHPLSRPSGLPRGSACRYVDFAIRDLASRLDSLGALRSETEVKLFGGADVLLVPKESLRPTVGRLNAEMALAILAAEGFTITASSLGGRRGLHLRFHTGTGEVLLRRLDR